MITLHQFFTWHKADWRILWRNKDGSVVAIACAHCTCPKEAMGYLCQTRVYTVDGITRTECGTWDGFEVWDRGFDGLPVGHRTDDE